MSNGNGASERSMIESEETAGGKSASQHVRRHERPSQVTSSSGQSPPLPKAVGGRRPYKRTRYDDDGDGVQLSPETTGSIYKAIESTEETLLHLKKIAGMEVGSTQKADARVPSEASWSDVEQLLPSKEDCELIIEYFFSDAHWQASNLHSGMFEKQWAMLRDGEQVSRLVVAMLCGMIAQSLLLAPSYHAVSRLHYQPRHHQFCCAAIEILYAHRSTVWDNPSTANMDELQAHCLVVTYLSFSGRASQAWQETGRAARLAKLYRLFDEEKWNMSELSDWEKEVRRRCGWLLCQNDWWVSLHFQLPPDLDQDFPLAKPLYYSDEAYSVDTGALQTLVPMLRMNHSFEVGKYLVSVGARQVNRFLAGFGRMSPKERYRSAREVESNLLRLTSQDWPSDMVFDCSCMTSTLSDPESARKVGQIILLYTSSLRLRCTVMRQFLLSRDAPMDLRMSALEQARRIIETTPIIVNLSSSPHSSFSSTWCSGNLFCAATTFATVYLGEGEQDLQDLNWFAGQIFEVIEALSFLSTKDLVAKRCEELLTALCTSRDWLRKRFHASHSGKVRRRKSTRSEVVPASDDIISGADLPFLRVAPELGNSHHEQGSNNKPCTPSALDLDGATSFAQGAQSLPTRLMASPASMQLKDLASPHGASDISQSGSNGSDGVENWPLLDEQQWFSLLNALERDMNSLSGTQVATVT